MNKKSRRRDKPVPYRLLISREDILKEMALREEDHRLLFEERPELIEELERAKRLINLLGDLCESKSLQDLVALGRLNITKIPGCE